MGFFNKNTGIQFVTTANMNHYIQEEFRKAKKFILILSPYIQLNEKISYILAEQIKKGVKVTIIYRENENNYPIDIECDIVNRPTLHAKCYITENMALVASLNLYEYSQKNNDEMGFIVFKEQEKAIYAEIFEEAKRLQDNKNSTSDGNKYSLTKGQNYPLDHLNTIFDFNYKKPSGIKLCEKHNCIVLFSNKYSSYDNEKKSDVILYEGQNTGSDEQKLIYGNKELHDAYHVSPKDILYFYNYDYQGLMQFAKKPYQKDGKWLFPIKKQ
ncbi:MAG: hypothetical protein K0U45_01910 [Alphaproteobacteria bacterium]|nr:hypothetical protein [Alphaproteobacteria bacterium]